MPKFDVYITETWGKVIRVEAETEEDAAELVWEQDKSAVIKRHYVSEDIEYILEVK